MSVFVTLKNEGIVQFLSKAIEVHPVMEIRIDPQSHS